LIPVKVSFYCSPPKYTTTEISRKNSDFLFLLALPKPNSARPESDKRRRTVSKALFKDEKRLIILFVLNQHKIQTIHEHLQILSLTLASGKEIRRKIIVRGGEREAISGLCNREKRFRRWGKILARFLLISPLAIALIIERGRGIYGLEAGKHVSQ
jgi:hypothetical protein